MSGRLVTDRRSRTRDRGPDDAGVVAVEFALIVPLLIVLLFTIVLGGSIYLDQLHLQSAARDGARIGSVAPSSACAAATSSLAGNDVGGVSCDVVQNCSGGTSQVRLTANQTVSLPIVGVRHVILRASSSFACKA
jgi:Flp pilus assembly protein TadG